MHLGWSQFAINQNTKMPVWLGADEELLRLAARFWDKRVPGAGRADLSQVVIVPIDDAEALQKCARSWVPIEKAQDFETIVIRRQPGEDPFLLTTARGPALPVTSLKVVLYSRATLLENNGETSGDYDWEIVAILASSWNEESMNPLTMARNYLEKTGGTKAPYTALQLAESIYFWSGYVRLRHD